MQRIVFFTKFLRLNLVKVSILIYLTELLPYFDAVSLYKRKAPFTWKGAFEV